MILKKLNNKGKNTNERLLKSQIKIYFPFLAEATKWQV